jgi:hypothetical protein
MVLEYILHSNPAKLQDSASTKPNLVPSNILFIHSVERCLIYGKEINTTEHKLPNGPTMEIAIKYGILMTPKILHRPHRAGIEHDHLLT